MIDHETTSSTSTSARRWGSAAALVAAGLAGGIVIAGTVSANAATTAPSPSASSGSTAGSGSATTPQHPTGDQSKSQRPDETLLTGSDAEKVTAAALAKYPGATIQRVETDSDGVYEAHIVTAAGDWIIVQVGADFTVTGTQQPGMGGHGGGHGGPNGVDPDPNDNDGPGTGNPGGSNGSTTAPTPSSTA